MRLGRVLPTRAFLVLSLAFGALFLVLTPPLQAPDEARHLLRAYLVANGTLLADRSPGQVANVRVPRSLVEMKRRLAPKSAAGDRHQDPARLAAELREGLWPEDRVEIALPSLYSPLPYLPPALGVLAGQALGAPPVAFVWLGRALNLAFYVGCVLLALRITPAHGFAFLLLALTPMALFEAASLAADGPANALAFLLAAAVLRAADPARPSVGARDVALLALVAGALALTKQAYAPLAAAALAIPAARFRSRRAWGVGVATVPLVALAAAGLWFALLRGLELPRLTYASDPAAQLRFIAAHPLEFAEVLLHTAVARTGAWVRTFVGVLGSLDVPLPAFVYALHPLLLLAVAALDGGPRSPVRGAARLVFLGVALATGVSVLLLAYVGWTRPGDDTVRHVQGRYFIPLAPFVAAALHLSRGPRLPRAVRAAALAWSVAMLALSVVALADRYWSPAALAAAGAAGDAAAEGQVAAQLEALGYVAEVTDELDPSESGVVLHDASRASPGVNVYCSVQGDRVHFLDMEGRELHTIALQDVGDGADCMLEPYGERSFLALAWPTLTLLDFDSHVLWRSEEGQHHDVSVDESGRVWSVLQQEATLVERGYTLPIVDSLLARQGPGGELELQLPLSALFAQAVPEERLARLAGLLRRGAQRSPAYAETSDLFHFNTVEVLDRDLAVGRRGQLLLCARELDMVAVVDPEARSIVWSFGPGELDRPHHPSVLPNGNLLIFDNGSRRGWSRVLELEPATGRIVWQYRGEPPKSFSSPVRGSAQALPNGNVLVTESTRGRVFEITRDGAVVWTFMNPDFEAQSRRQIYRMWRVPLERYAAWAGSSAGPRP